jgi:hypothetical protein
MLLEAKRAALQHLFERAVARFGAFRQLLILKRYV